MEQQVNKLRNSFNPELHILRDKNMSPDELHPNPQNEQPVILQLQAKKLN